MLSYEFGETFKNNFFEEHVRTAAFENMRVDEREVKAKFAICVIEQYNKNKISRTVPPWTTAPVQFLPGQLPPGQLLHGQLPLRAIDPRTIPT